MRLLIWYVVYNILIFFDMVFVKKKNLGRFFDFKIIKGYYVLIISVIETCFSDKVFLLV